MIFRFLPLALLAFATAMPTLAQDAPASAGPSQISEVYGDWTVNCGTSDGVRDCAISQSLMDTDTRQHVLTLELYAAGQGTLEGMMVLPFGLNFGKGVALGVDDMELGVPLPFLTCLPTGCLVPVIFGSDDADRLRAGTTLAITGTSAAGEEAVPLSISLAGFTGATARIAELAR